MAGDVSVAGECTEEVEAFLVPPEAAKLLDVPQGDESMRLSPACFEVHQQIGPPGEQGGAFRRRQAAGILKGRRAYVFSVHAWLHAIRWRLPARLLLLLQPGFSRGRWRPAVPLVHGARDGTWPQLLRRSRAGQ